METTPRQEEYIDLHAWCFTPQRFRLMIEDLYKLGLIPFREVCFLDTAGCEFYISLSRGDEGVKKYKLELSMLSQEEN